MILMAHNVTRKTMLFGMAAIAAGLGAFWYSQSYIHKADDQTCEYPPFKSKPSEALIVALPVAVLDLQRQNKQVDDTNSSTRIVGGKQDSMFKPKESGYIPTPPK